MTLLETLFDILEKYLPELYHDIENMLPGQVTLDGKFSFFGGENETVSYSARVNSGAVDMSKYMQFVEYNGDQSLIEDWWQNFPESPNDDRNISRG